MSTDYDESTIFDRWIISDFQKQLFLNFDLDWLKKEKTHINSIILGGEWCLKESDKTDLYEQKWVIDNLIMILLSNKR